MYNHAVTLGISIITDFDADELDTRLRCGDQRAYAQVLTAIHRRIMEFYDSPDELAEAICGDIFDTYESDDDDLRRWLTIPLDNNQPGQAQRGGTLS